MMFQNIILFENFDQGLKLPKFVDLAPVTPYVRCQAYIWVTFHILTIGDWVYAQITS